MPELPEVETVVRTLERQINNWKIEKVDILWKKIIDHPDAESFAGKLVGESFREFSRRGKFLIFTLDHYHLVTHLRMEGKFYIYHEPVELNKHTLMVLHTDKGDIHYNDVRKFGKFYLYDLDEPIEAISELGPEPFSEELTSEYLKQFCKGKNLAIKSQLLSQDMIAGIGNIYADEICFAAGLDPLKSCRFISRNDWSKIIDATRSILASAIKAGGTTIRSYTSSLGVTGLFQLNLMAHSREKEPCHICGTPIKKIRVNGRGTYYCPVCQKPKAILVGVTGNIGSGKSTVCQHYRDMNLPVISCDEVNSTLLEKETTIVSLAEIFNCDPAEVDREYIRNRIFADEAIKEKVEECLHDLIWKQILAFYKEHEDEKAVIVEVPLLFETDWYKRFDYNIVVISERNDLVNRLKTTRNMSEKQIEQFLSSQIPDERKIELADCVIKNDSSIKELQTRAESRLSVISKHQN